MNYSKIGERLKLIRERKGLSYEQIFEITKIQPYILKGIEEGKSLVSPVFLKGFIRTYASSLGLDPDVLFQLSESGVKKKEETKKKEVAKIHEKTKRKYLLYLLPLLIFFLILKVIWLTKMAKDAMPGHQEKPKDLVNQALGVANQIPPEDQPIPSPPVLKNSDQKSQNLEKTQEKTAFPSDSSLFQEIKNSVFTQEILIQSSEAMEIYFKLDKKSTITKRLNPSEWFYIKAKESIYLRFDKIQGDVQIFHNGKKEDLKSHKGFFEKSFP